MIERQPVVSLPSDLSPVGAYDMAANAWEWTSEYFDSQYYLQFRAPGAAIPPDRDGIAFDEFQKGPIKSGRHALASRQPA